MKAALRRLPAALAALLFWTALWVLLARLVGQELLLPSPLAVLRTLAAMVRTQSFWLATLRSILRVLAGLLAATLLGVLLAALTEYSAAARILLSPAMTLVKSTPVASFIILALLWIGRDVLPAFITALMVLPVVWSNVSAGLAGRDRQLLELAEVYRLPRLRVLRQITIPSVLPHFRAALRSSLGMGWKAGIAAEVLTVPALSIGKNIFEAKLYLETAELFAWTLTVIVLSLIIERVLLRLVGRIGRKGGGACAGA